MPGPVDRVDDFQRRHSVAGFPLAVAYKFFDDQGNYLAAVVTYYAFVAIFPLLLIASQVLGFILQGDPGLQEQVLASALSQFPIVGTQLGQPEGLQGSTSAVVVGSLAALYGVIGLGQAAQNAVNVAWAVPRNSRFNPLVSRASSLVMLVLAGLTVLAITVLTSVASHVDVFGTAVDGWLLAAASMSLNAVVLAVLLRLATARRQPIRASFPGAVTVAVLWQLLQLLGGAYVKRVVSRATDVDAVFAVVLGLVALIYVASVIAVLGLEINVVLSKRLFPRALLTPFTDSVDLTEADRRAYAAYAKAQRHKGFERVRVTFRSRTEDEDVPAD
ncbi:MAG: YihY/virulence factor BrkB family protein [Nocardioidaceae bacterium]